MKNTAGFTNRSRRSACLGAVFLCATMLGSYSLVAGETATPSKSVLEPAQEETYNNWVDLSLGGLIVHGDQAQFSQEHRVTGDVFGGVEDMHIERTVGKAQLTLDGRAIFDQSDYMVKLELSQANVGYIRAGYTQFRTWYDGSGGYFPPNGAFFNTVNGTSSEYALDRGDAWIELGLRMPNLPEITLRYDHIFREGDKDSTSWGSATVNGLTRKLAPAFRGIDEQRDIFTLDMTKTVFGKTDLALGMRYEHVSNNDSLNIAFPSTPNYLTQNDQLKYDLFSGHFTSETRFSDKLWFTLGYSYTTMDSDIGGSRIYGPAFNSPFVGLLAGAGTGFMYLSGGSDSDQHVINLNLMWTPIKSLTITPSVRIEKNDTVSDSFFTMTNSAGLNALPAHVFSEYDYLNVSECLDLRYTGFENWLLYASLNYEEENGNRRDNSSGATDRSTTGVSPFNLNADATYLRQKYAAGANWYPLPRLNLAVQYYHKNETNDNTFHSDDTAPIANQRLVEQTLNMDDVNFRVTVRPLSNLSLVTRYDFQFSTIDSHWKQSGSPEIYFADGQSSATMNHMITESATWNPWSWMYIQGNFSYVLNETRTPAATLVPSVLNFQNDYWTASCSLGVALDDKTKLQADYTYYRANDYVNNATAALGTSGGVPYGAGATEHTVSASVSRQITKNVGLTLRYSYYNYNDQTSGGNNNYDAHMISSGVQVRF
jgi:hypothetical protein